MSESKTAAAAAAAAASTTAETESVAYLLKHHIKYFTHHLQGVTHHYTSLDVNRMTLLYFSLAGLDVLGELTKSILPDTERVRTIINWIYAMQIQPDAKTGDVMHCGFRGAPYIGEPFDCVQASRTSSSLCPMDESNLSQTYTAISCLRMLGDDLSRVNKKAIIGALKYLQQENGSFVPLPGGAECDVRFVFCAVAISSMLNDWSGFDLDRTTQFIVSCQSYDGGFGLIPDAEGHGGATYCAVAALTLMNRIDRIRDIPALLKWCITLQGEGYRGRPNKPCDSCYSFWTGATVKMLGATHLTQPKANREFNLKCQHATFGGFGKTPGDIPDLMHSYYGTCGMSLFGLDGLNTLNVSLGLTERVTGPERSYSMPTISAPDLSTSSCCAPKPQVKSCCTPEVQEKSCCSTKAPVKSCCSSSTSSTSSSRWLWGGIVIVAVAIVTATVLRQRQSNP